MQRRPGKTIIAKSIDLEWNLAKLGAKTLRTFGEAVAKAVETEGGEQSSAVADIVVDYINDGAEGAASAGEEVTVRGTTELIHKFADAAHGFAEIVGQVNVTYRSPRYAVPAEVELCCLDGQDMVNLADPSGQYDLIVPLQSEDSDYSDLTLSLRDPITDTELDSETVDLSGLTTRTPFTLPTMTGSCIDDDAADPDGDDPDCDSTTPLAVAHAVRIARSHAALATLARAIPKGPAAFLAAATCSSATPNVMASPTKLAFAATRNAAGTLTTVTPAQDVTVTVGDPAIAWTASANQPWVKIVEAVGRFTVSISDPTHSLAPAANATATITIATTSAWHVFYGARCAHNRAGRVPTPRLLSASWTRRSMVPRVSRGRFR